MRSDRRSSSEKPSSPSAMQPKGPNFSVEKSAESSSISLVSSMSDISDGPSHRRAFTAVSAYLKKSGEKIHMNSSIDELQASGNSNGSAGNIHQSNNSLHAVYNKDIKTKASLFDINTTTFADFTEQTLLIRKPVERKHLNSLQTAVFDRNSLKMSLLLGETKRDINKLDSYHRITALHLAIDLGYSEIAKILITGHTPHASGVFGSGSKRADLNIGDLEGRTCLHLAVIRRQIEIAELLIQFRADVNSVDVLGCTPLHYAILTQNFLLCRSLIAAGARLDVVDSSGMTLAHHAIRIGDERLACEIIEQGHEFYDFILSDLTQLAKKLGLMKMTEFLSKRKGSSMKRDEIKASAEFRASPIIQVENIGNTKYSPNIVPSTRSQSPVSAQADFYSKSDAYYSDAPLIFGSKALPSSAENQIQPLTEDLKSSASSSVALSFSDDEHETIQVLRAERKDDSKNIRNPSPQVVQLALQGGLKQANGDDGLGVKLFSTDEVTVPDTRIAQIPSFNSSFHVENQEALPFNTTLPLLPSESSISKDPVKSNENDIKNLNSGLFENMGTISETVNPHSSFNEALHAHQSPVQEHSTDKIIAKSHNMVSESNHSGFNDNHGSPVPSKHQRKASAGVPVPPRHDLPLAGIKTSPSKLAVVLNSEIPQSPFNALSTAVPSPVTGTQIPPAVPAKPTTKAKVEDLGYQITNLDDLESVASVEFDIESKRKLAGGGNSGHKRGIKKQQKLTELTDEITKAKAEIRLCKEKTRELEKIIESKDNYENSIQEYQREIQACRGSLEEVTNELLVVKDEKAKMRAEMELTLEQIAWLSNNLEESHAKAKRTLSEAIQSHQKDSKELNEKLAQSSKEITSLQEKLDTTQQEKLKAETVMKNMGNELSRIKDSVKTDNQNAEDYKMQADKMSLALQAAMDSKAKDIELLQSDKIDLEKSLCAALTEISSLKQLVSCIQHEQQSHQSNPNEIHSSEKNNSLSVQDKIKTVKETMSRLSVVTTVKKSSTSEYPGSATTATTLVGESFNSEQMGTRSPTDLYSGKLKVPSSDAAEFRSAAMDLERFIGNYNSAYTLLEGLYTMQNLKLNEFAAKIKEKDLYLDGFTDEIVHIQKAIITDALAHFNDSKNCVQELYGLNKYLLSNIHLKTESAEVIMREQMPAEKKMMQLESRTQELEEEIVQLSNQLENEKRQSSIILLQLEEAKLSLETAQKSADFHAENLLAAGKRIEEANLAGRLAKISIEELDAKLKGSDQQLKQNEASLAAKSHQISVLQAHVQKLELASKDETEAKHRATSRHQEIILKLDQDILQANQKYLQLQDTLTDIEKEKRSIEVELKIQTALLQKKLDFEKENAELKSQAHKTDIMIQHLQEKVASLEREIEIRNYEAIQQTQNIKRALENSEADHNSCQLLLSQMRGEKTQCDMKIKQQEEQLALLHDKISALQSSISNQETNHMIKQKRLENNAKSLRSQMQHHSQQNVLLSQQLHSLQESQADYAKQLTTEKETRQLAEIKLNDSVIHRKAVERDRDLLKDDLSVTQQMLQAMKKESLDYVNELRLDYEAKLKLKLNSKLSKIANTIKRQSKERRLIEKERGNVESELRSTFEEEIEMLLQELAHLRKLKCIGTCEHHKGISSGQLPTAPSPLITQESYSKLTQGVNQYPIVSHIINKDRKQLIKASLSDLSMSNHSMQTKCRNVEHHLVKLASTTNMRSFSD